MRKRFLTAIVVLVYLNVFGVAAVWGRQGTSSSVAKEPIPSGLQETSNLAELKQKAVKVYIDCEDCDMEYIKTEIPFVNYVRDRKEADVHVLITTQTTGSGGTEYTLAFIGQGAYSAINSTLVYASQKTDTDEELRRGYTGVLKMGLIPYASRTPLSKMIDISFKEKVKPTDVLDKWNFWVFSFSLGGEMNGESQEKSKSLYGNFSAAKVMPDIKIRMGLSGYWETNEFKYDERTITSSSESGEFSGLFVKSLSDHWSAGFFLNVSSSSYSNLDLKIVPAPAVEFDLFPYSQSTRRQLRFLYKVGYEFVKYREMTIYEKTKESLLGQSLSATLEIREPWGTLEASLEGSHYFHDFQKNRLELSTELSFRIFKGLEFNIDARYERVRNQLNLAMGDIPLEEVLLRRKELATNYDYFLSVSLSYTFGSIYSNVVNPRFGNGNGDQGPYEGWGH